MPEVFFICNTVHELELALPRSCYRRFRIRAKLRVTVWQVLEWAEELEGLLISQAVRSFSARVSDLPFCCSLRRIVAAEVVQLHSLLLWWRSLRRLVSKVQYLRLHC